MSGPLAGVKVLDFAWALVGGITTKVLADCGAEVVKVETSTRPCLSRIDVQVSASKPGSFDDKPWFAHLNTSKKSLRLDMKNRRAREVLDPLIDWADVVVENFSPGTMAKLGLDYESLKKRRPDIIMVSGSVYGQTGPLAQEWGIDGTAGAASGRLVMTGYADRPPVNPSAVPYGDVILPYLMAGAACAALERRRHTGEGAHIDASMYEVCTQQMTAALIAQQKGAPLTRRGNRDAGLLYQAVLPARGDDRWLAVTIPSAVDWATFTAWLGGDWPGAAEVGAMDDAALDALDARIGAITAPQVDFEMMEALQGRGLAAGVMQDSEDLVDRDPQIRHRGSLVPVEHAVLGEFGHMTTPFRLSRTPVEVRRPPSLGEHVDEVCQAIVGLSAEEVASLRQEEVFK
jgi:crotonobetainyl-CoA:carnitine CoA-transferase CaiB-like acyl-CoA transferase